MAKRNKRGNRLPESKTSMANAPSARDGNSDVLPAKPFLIFLRDGQITLFCLVLFVLTIVVLLPALHGDFIQFDDGEYVTQNAHVNTGLTWENIDWSLRSLEDCNWHPLTWWTHMVDCQFYGLRPAGHHLTNVLIHALNTVLVFLLLRTLTAATWRSLVVALLFGLHPLRVESVVWISERKDVLCVMFSLLTFWTYAKYADLFKTGNSKSKPYYGLALALFSCALMSKPMAVTVPFVLLLLDYWPLEFWKHKSARRLLVEKLPFFVLAAAVSTITVIAQKQGGTMSELGQLSFGLRFENALVSYCRYLGKLFWPEHLCALYPYPEHWPLNEVLPAGLLLLGISIFTFMQRRQRPYLLIGWLWFLGTLAPVIGLFVQAGPQSMADRYSYLPCIGILIAVVWGAYELTKRRRFPTAASSVVACAVVAVFIPLTVIQISYWKNGVTVWKRAVELTQNNFAAEMRLGLALLSDKRFEEALPEFQKAVDLRPDNSAANWLLAGQLNRIGRLNDAIVHYQQSLAIDPSNSLAEYGLGGCYFKQGQYDKAVVHFQKAAGYNPYDANIQNDLGVAFLRNKQLNDAIGRFQDALMLSPDY
ncbi:MAG TPA: tetratricopeptide repeat protein, partial [Candidatus Saccharimonadales bacterium]|nr:tetratricopeptide repeat protein [Candidatus Saccharimonadales bacterium]